MGRNAVRGLVWGLACVCLSVCLSVCPGPGWRFLLSEGVGRSRNFGARTCGMVLESRDLHFGVRDLVRFFDFGRVGPALSGMRKTWALGSRAERFIAKVNVSRRHEGPAGPKLNFA